MNHNLLGEAATIARFLNKEVINRNFTFETERTPGEHSGIMDSLYLVDRNDHEQRIKVWELKHDG